MPALFTTPIFQALDDNGAPLLGAKLLFYEAGTTTPRDVFSDAGLSTAISQPVIADSAGRFEDIYMAAADYKAVLQNSASVEVWTQDNYTPPASGSANLLNGISTQAAARTAISAGAATDVSANTTAVASVSAQITAAGGTLRAMAGKADVSASDLAADFGAVVRKRHWFTNTATAALGSGIPIDSSIPQSTEGAEIFNEDITPTVSGNKLVINAVINIDGYTGFVTAALFVAGGASAVGVYSNDGRSTMAISFEYETASVSPVNVMIRGAGGTLNFGSTFGAGVFSSLEVLEIQETS